VLCFSWWWWLLFFHIDISLVQLMERVDPAAPQQVVKELLQHVVK
jgi:hypothetical protein